MANGRCRLHGGKSTGPRTAEGLEQIRRAKTKHSSYSAETIQLMRAIRALVFARVLARRRLVRVWYPLCGLLDYSTTSSACWSNNWGTVRSSDFALFKLKANRKTVGCSNGRSAGFAPFRMRSTR
jgi:hypothetical protein